MTRTRTVPSFALVAAALLSAALPSCAGKRASGTDSIESIGVPAGKKQAASSAQSDGASNADKLPHVPLGGGEELLGLYELDVDQDQVDEQVVAFRSQNDPQGSIQLCILDQIPPRDSWERIWTGQTAASAWPTFGLSLKDMLGAFGTDLVCTGMNAAGRQTMTIFHREANAPTGAFRPILHIEGDSIDIKEGPRPDAYMSGQAPASPFTVQSFDQDKASSNFLDQIQTDWNWDAAAAAYAKGSSIQVTRGKIEQGLIEQYLNRGSAAMEKFLNGTWYQESGSGGSGPRLIQFDLANRGISFTASAHSGSLTDYNWENSQSTALGLYISATNSAVDKMRRFIDIELTGTDTISLRSSEDNEDLRIASDDSWNGGYRRLEANDEPPSSPSPATPPALSSLDGTWSAMGGVEAGFIGKSYWWIENGQREEGAFSRYPVGNDTVIVLTALTESGLIKRSRTFLIGAHAAPDGKPQILLQPAVVTVNGIEISDQDSIALTKYL